MDSYNEANWINLQMIFSFSCITMLFYIFNNKGLELQKS